VTEVPAVIRHMTPVEVIEAQLSENLNRSDLAPSEEVRAIERLMSLDAGLTPACSPAVISRFPRLQPCDLARCFVDDVQHVGWLACEVGCRPTGGCSG